MRVLIVSVFLVDTLEGKDGGHRAERYRDEQKRTRGKKEREREKERELSLKPETAARDSGLCHPHV